MRHHGLGLAAEKGEEFIYQSAVRIIARDGSFEYVGIADALHNPHSPLGFQPVDRGLDRCVGGPPRFGEGLLNLANRAWPPGPDHLHDLQFQLGKPGGCHDYAYAVSLPYYHHSWIASGKCEKRRSYV